jgi:hypothetical protein
MQSRSARRIRVLLGAGMLSLVGGTLAAHDLFLKLSSYFLPPETAVQALLLNGTWTRSENAIERDRIASFSLAGPSGIVPLDTIGILPRGDSTRIRFRTGAAGTYGLGLSVRSREIALSGPEFNAYLKEEGMDDVLAERTRTGTLEEPARERYAKHVKAVFQVGETRTDSYGAVLGYPAELVPLDNPYTRKVGDVVRFRCLVNGQATAGLTVLAGGTAANGTRIREVRSRSDTSGIALVRLSAPGRWYVKFIRMRKVAEGEVTHESQWATLTFQVR